MARLIARRFVILRPDLVAPPVEPQAKSRPGRPAGVQLELRTYGLGDWVEVWAKPIARWLDARRVRPGPIRWLVAGAVACRLVTVPLAGCSACSSRRRWLNQLLPHLASWHSWNTAPRRLWVLLSFKPRANARPTPGGVAVQPATTSAPGVPSATRAAGNHPPARAAHHYTRREAPRSGPH